MRIATWNVNSIRTRLERLLGVLERHRPDVLCLQEIKVEEADFPLLDLREVGYEAAVLGQRTYNGVAILARQKLARVRRSLDDGIEDGQSRLIEAQVDGVRVLSVYVPNGGEVGSDKWEYKLQWIGRLKRYLESNADPDEPLAICGDFNVAPDDKDVSFPERWSESVLCHPDGRRALAELVDWGLVDAFRRVHPEGGIYSWWDYRKLSFPKKDGLRIDGVYVTRPLAERVLAAVVDRDERKGKQPSDHAPVIIDLRD